VSWLDRYNLVLIVSVYLLVTIHKYSPGLAEQQLHQRTRLGQFAKVKHFRFRFESFRVVLNGKNQNISEVDQFVTF
jgi:hypothetical protein